MPANSVNTNFGAQIALQALNATNRELAEVRNRISTGLKIASAKDNPAVWAIAQNARAESQSLEAVKASLKRGQSIADVAVSAGQTISDILVQMKEKAVAATEAGLTTASRQALSDEYVALRRQIDTIAAGASFDGVNLISAGGTGQIRALANSDASSTIDVDHIDLSTTGSAVGAVLADLTGAVGQADLADLDSAIQKVSSALSVLGVGGKALDRHLGFVEALQDSIDAGVGNLVDADIAAESARLQALQVKQQLAIQALTIANNAPSILLSLFR
ncbi:MAG: flagellin [Phenylobacterium sp.]|uniref:flagellin n=1 Tax=Phenylobacterium sp. TaxID=1871053 RepID=UPI00391D6347